MKRCRLINIGIILTLITLFMYISDDTSKIMEERIHLALAGESGSSWCSPNIFRRNDRHSGMSNTNRGVFSNIRNRFSGCSSTVCRELLKGLGFSILNVGNVLNLKKDILISDLSNSYAKGKHPWKKTMCNILVLGLNIGFAFAFLNFLLNSFMAYKEDTILNGIFNIVVANTSNTFGNASTTESSKELLQNHSTTSATEMAEMVDIMPEYTEGVHYQMPTMLTESYMNLLNTTVATGTTAATKLYDKFRMNAPNLIGFMSRSVIACIWAIFGWTGFNVLSCYAYTKLSKFSNRLPDVENPVYALWHIALFSALIPVYLFTLTLSNAAFLPLNILGALGGLSIASLFALAASRAWCKKFFGAADMIGSVLSLTFILTYIHSLFDSRFTCANQSCTSTTAFLATIIAVFDCVLRMVNLFCDTPVIQ